MPGAHVESIVSSGVMPFVDEQQR
eukprot:COSAG06_NODE_28084_length_581_cov_0.707469_1_plen_23_part_10